MPSAVWGQSKTMAIHEPGSKPSLVTKSTRVLILNFSASRTVRNKHLGYPVYGIWVLAAQMDSSQIASESPGSLDLSVHAPWSAKLLARLT